MFLLLSIMILVSSITLVLIGTFLVAYKNEETIGFIVIAVAIILLITIEILDDLEEHDYKQGQIDALSGEVKYKLVTNPDSTRTWIEKKRQ